MSNYRIFTSLFLFFCLITNISGQNKSLETAGDVILVALPITAITSSIIIGDKKGSWQFVKGFAVNQLLTFGLKEVIDKERPDGSNNNSFPSGHTSTTFQSASFIQRRYGWKYGFVAYALAGFTAYSRLEADKHDGWDILGGVIIGVGSTYIFTTPYQKEHFELTFNSDRGDYTIGLKYKL